MKQLHKATVAGLLIMVIAGIVMALLGKPVPDLAAWIFFAGLAVTLVSALFLKQK